MQFVYDQKFDAAGDASSNGQTCNIFRSLFDAQIPSKIASKSDFSLNPRSVGGETEKLVRDTTRRHVHM